MDLKLKPNALEAVADLQKVYATTGRPRDMIKPVFTGQGMAKDIQARQAQGIKCGVMFGPERTGLENEAVKRKKRR